MSGSVRWASEAAVLAEEVAAIGGGPLGLDSEADSFHHYREKVCLIQLSFAGKDLLVDPLAGIDLSPLGPVLADRGVRKILHGADYDLRILHRDFGLEICGLFDTMIAARLAGERSFGLAALLHKHLNVRLDKRFQKADWSIRPLPGDMERYAVLDTRYLLPLAEILEGRLAELGRGAWAAEEFHRLEAVRWSAEPPDPDAFLRVKGAGRLDGQELAVLRELFELRERDARERDVPVFRVLPSEILIRLARAMPAGTDALAGIPGLPRGWARGRAGRELLGAVGRGRGVPASQRPVAPRRGRPRRDPARESRLRRLCRERDRLAHELDLEPSVLASRAVLDRALELLDRGRGLEEHPEMRRWQADLLAPIVQGG